MSAHSKAPPEDHSEGAVPALVRDKGAVITASCAVLEYFADVGKEASLGAD